ncbi:MAG: farnesyl diphosphate synthase [Pseudomonadota bacterium]
MDAALREDFATRLKTVAARAEAALDRLLPTPAGAEAPIAEAMRHAAMGGGKRLRAFLVVEAAEMLGAPGDRADRVGAALECLHAYSLVHDDLPCMDDDDLRRGQPTVHVKWDEATAVLAGDALQTEAFAILAHAATHPEGRVQARLVATLAAASGQYGMVGGQAIDIAAETAAAPLGLAEITRLQALKTGALITCAARSGAILAEAGAEAEAALSAYAEALGLAFQIQDDILDVEGDAEAAGKRLRKDEAAGKATFVSLLGLEGAKAKAEAEVAAAVAHLDRFGPAADHLRACARFVIQRKT